MRAALEGAHLSPGVCVLRKDFLIDEYQLLVEIAVYYATWGVLAYILTLGKSSSGARSWVFTGQIVKCTIVFFT